MLAVTVPMTTVAAAAQMTVKTLSAADTVGFDPKGAALAGEVEAGLRAALAGGDVLQNDAEPLQILRATAHTSIRYIRTSTSVAGFRRRPAG
jgi:hypothetical protein